MRMSERNTQSKLLLLQQKMVGKRLTINGQTLQNETLTIAFGMVEHVVVALLKERDIRPIGGDGMWGDKARVGDVHKYGVVSWRVV